MPKSVSSAMTGRLALGGGGLGDRLAEYDFPEVVLQQELLGDAQRLEQPLDIAGRQRPLLSAGPAVRAVLKVLTIGHDVSRESWRGLRRRFNNVEQRE